MQALTPADLQAIDSETAFEKAVFHTFQYQYEHCDVYRSYCDLINRNPSSVNCLKKLPYLPVSLFKSRSVITGNEPIQTVFRSSGTTASTPAQHFVSDLNLYEWSFRKAFANDYGAIEDFVVLALLPSYLERQDASLVYMVSDMIAKSGKKESGFYLNEWEALAEQLQHLEAQGQKTLLIGVSFALLDFGSRFPQQLHHTTVMETGGRKGRKKELVRSELHRELQKTFGTSSIHSEYGMTEMLSQAYAQKEGLFSAPSWMDISIRDTTDPFYNLALGQIGGINVIDLANQNSCAFLATQDLGKKHDNKRFEVLGRFDTAEIRGCNLMAGDASQS